MNKRTTKWYRKNEEEVIKRLGLKPTRNSGATWIEKADGQNDDYICELKSTDKESFSVKQSVLHKLEAQAIEAHKLPLFAFQFINTDEVWVAVKESDIEAIRSLIRQQLIDELCESGKKKDDKLSPILLSEHDYLMKNKPDCFGDISVEHTDDCYACKLFFECDEENEKKSIDKEEQNKYNIVISSRNAGKTFLARQAYEKQRQREKEEQEKLFKKKNRERRKEHWKRNSNKKD